jgi:hypothetical protein
MQYSPGFHLWMVTPSSIKQMKEYISLLVDLCNWCHIFYFLTSFCISRCCIALYYLDCIFVLHCIIWTAFFVLQCVIWTAVVVLQCVIWTDFVVLQCVI